MRRRFRRRVGAVATLLALTLATATVPAETVSIEHDGLILNGRYEPGPPGAPVVLMLHGTLAHADMEIMTTLREVFREEGWGSLAVSLGLAESDRSGMYPCDSTHRHLADDAMRELPLWLEWLDARDVGRIVLLGHSRGGLQMAAFAAGDPRPGVEALVLVAPTVAGDRSAAAAYRERFGEDLEPLLSRAEALVAAGEGEALMEGVGFLYCDDARVSAASFASYYAAAAPEGVENLIGAVPYPVLVVAGGEDQVVTGLPVALASHLEDPRISLVEIDGADHFFRDLYAYDVVEAVQDFVGDHSP
jgi:pimeloyl-ACP methyl ester carboxylesterase